MTHVVCLFNHKGGVSKTTTTFNLAWMLSKQGKRVMMVDGDPQCNLTGTVLGFEQSEDFENFYQCHPRSNISESLRPAFEGKPEELRPAGLIPVSSGPPGLYLLAGHINLATYEPQLAVSLSTGAALPALSNLPGAINTLLRKTAMEYKVDVVLVDMSPSVGALNQTLFLSSDYFIVPTTPDYYCYQAIESLAKVLPQWDQNVQHIRTRQTQYRLPDRPPKFLGIISQRYRPRTGAPASAFQQWIDRINEAVQLRLTPVLAERGMAVSEDVFRSVIAGSPPYILATIADFNSLIAQSQKHNTPVFALTDAQLERQGVVLETMRNNRDRFREVFEHLAEGVLGLIAADSAHSG